MRRRLPDGWMRLPAILGVPGLLMGFFSLAAIAFGLFVLAREYDDPREAERQAVRDVIAAWVRETPVHYLGWTVVDYADRLRRAPASSAAASTERLAAAFRSFGATLDAHDVPPPLVRIVELHIPGPDGPPIASWKSSRAGRSPADETDRLTLLEPTADAPAVELVVRYRPAPEIRRVGAAFGVTYRRLIVALLGLSIFPFLCLLYMTLQARALRDRAAREAAQAATLDLADRTCHELGNVAFVLANEGRNLSDFLDLVDRFTAESDAVLRDGARRAGLPPTAAASLPDAVRRAYAERGLEPELELHAGAALAREVCRQIAVCSDYIALTVRELDGYLKHSSLPPDIGPIRLDEVVDDALAILRPRLDSASVTVARLPGPPGRALGDRRLLAHALVNLVKNAIEATAGTTAEPRVTFSIAESKGEITVSVSDNGPGIPADLRPRIFESGVSTKGAGRGHGLAVVRESVLAQAGRIELDSQPGAGATFRIVLPAAGDDERHRPDTPAAT